LLPSLALASENKIPPAKDQINFYQAQLVCPAAPLIGCGSAAKPILLELERDPHVSEAWLNRPGTNIAVIWKERMASRKRAKIIQAVLSEPRVHEIKRTSKKRTLLFCTKLTRAARSRTSPDDGFFTMPQSPQLQWK